MTWKKYTFWKWYPDGVGSRMTGMFRNDTEAIAWYERLATNPVMEYALVRDGSKRAIRIQERK